jgi:hypothetical protein
MKLVLQVLLVFALVGCTAKPTVVGLGKWEDVKKAADQLLLAADSTMFEKSLDASGISKARYAEFLKSYDWWRTASLRSHHQETIVLSLEECRRYVVEHTHDLPVAQLDSLLSWNVDPIKVLVYRFSKKEDSKESELEFYVGVYNRAGRWYFSFPSK